jgi:hypothetical protein
MTVTPVRPHAGDLGAVDLLSLAVEAAAEVAPFGLGDDISFDIRWTMGPESGVAYVPLRIHGDVVTSVMVRLALS